MWRRILALTIKEFQTLLKDKRSRLVIFVPPLIQLMVFGYAATFDLKHVPFAVFNEDRGSASRDLVAAFRGAPSFEEVGHLTHDQEIAPMIDSKRALLVIRIGPRFSADLLSGHPAALGFLRRDLAFDLRLFAQGFGQRASISVLPALLRIGSEPKPRR